MKTQGKLLARYLNDITPGHLNWIGLRPERKVPMSVVEQAYAKERYGLIGDRRCEGSPDSGRQVTIINQEDIGAIASLLSMSEIDPGILRRNLVVSGINLYALRYQQIAIGEAIFEINAHCHPCVRMEQALGNGAVIAMFGHGGFCAKIIRSGEIKVGDQVRFVNQSVLIN